MDYLEFDLDSAVATQTSIQGYASTDTPMFSMGRQIQNAVGFKIIETVIPASYFLVTDNTNLTTGYTRNYLTLVMFSGDITCGGITLTPNRTYTATQLATEVQTQLNASLQAGFYNPTATVTYNANTGKFTITITSNVLGVSQDLVLSMDPSLALIMGYAPATTTSDDLIQLTVSSDNSWVYTSTYIALTSGPNYINVNSKYFSSLVKNYLPQGPLGATGESNTQICQVPMYVDFGGISYWQDVQQDSFNLQNLFQINNFDLYLTLGTSTTPLVLNGIPWQCKIRVYIDTNTVAQSSAGNVDQLRVVRTVRQT
jgi:hypothetical protein